MTIREQLFANELRLLFRKYRITNAVPVEGSNESDPMNRPDKVIVFGPNIELDIMEFLAEYQHGG